MCSTKEMNNKKLPYFTAHFPTIMIIKEKEKLPKYVLKKTNINAFHHFECPHKLKETIARKYGEDKKTKS